jgi:hypothetical protein
LASAHLICAGARDLLRAGSGDGDAVTQERKAGDGTRNGGQPRRISVMGREFAMPRSRRLRIAIGAGLVVLGLLGFLPVLGFWMIPLGILVLSYEFASVRRFRRRFELWWAERRGRRRARRGKD